MSRLKFLIPIALLAAALPVFAQRSASTAQQQAQTKAIASVTTALTLTQAQVTSLTSFLATRKASLQTVEQTRQADEKALRTLMAEQSPDPTALGNAMLAVKGAGAQAKQVETTFQTSFTGILTPAQQQIFAAWQNAAQNLGPFRALGLISGPGGGRGGPGPMLRGRRGFGRGGPGGPIGPGGSN